MKTPLVLVAIVAFGCSRKPLGSEDSGSAGINGGGLAGVGGDATGGIGGVATAGTSGVGGGADGGTGGVANPGGGGGVANGGNGGAARGGADGRGGSGVGGVANGGVGGVAGAGSGGSAGTSAGGVTGRGGAGGTGGAAGSAAGRGGAIGGDPGQPGQPCAASAECRTAFCVDGVCCTSACIGACRSCGLVGSLGVCQTVSAGARDPRGLCVATSPKTCGSDGTCDGNGGCRNYPRGTVCTAESCKDTLYSPPSRCDGAGTCPPPDALSCSPYKCDASGTRCEIGCLDDRVCVAPLVCRNFQCRLPNEPSCTDDNVCASGHCAQNVCCATACAGPCNSCVLAGTVGTCMPVPNPDPSWNCPPRP